MKEKIILNEYYQQIILACKGWGSEYYTREEKITRILAQFIGINKIHVTGNVVYEYLVKIVKEVSPKSLNRLYEGLFRYNDSISVYKVNQSLMSILANLSVLDENKNELIELVINKDILDWEGKLNE